MYTVDQINEVIKNGSFTLVEGNALHGSFSEYINNAEMIFFSDVDNYTRNYYKNGSEYYMVACTKDFKSVSLYKYQTNN